MNPAGDYVLRTSGAQLPSARELLHILEKESQREAVRFDYLQKKAHIFDAHRELSKLAGADDGWIDDYPSLSLKEVVGSINHAHLVMKTYIEQNNEASLYSEVFSSLVPEQRMQKSEAIFVFGSQSNARVERAVELYKQGIAPKIILSGKGPHYRDHEISEAERMAQFAVGSGVPREALILENSSVTVPDNVKRSLDLMEVLNWRPKSLTIIASSFVLQRGMMEWYKFPPEPMDILPVAAKAISPHLNAENWHRNAESVALVLNEYAKLVLESKIDLLRNAVN